MSKLRAHPDLKDIPLNELKDYLLKIYDNRRLVNGRLYNNATSDNTILTQEDFINMYLNKPYILSGYACFYENQDNSMNISSAALENLGDMRKFNKKKMEAAEHGSDDYVYYRILQLTYKVLMNSYYGILGEKNSVFYNPFVQNSITLTGQDLITTSIIGMENFLQNNVPFEDTDDAITFIMNVKNDNRKFSIMDYVDAPISAEELTDYLVGHGRHEESVNREIISEYISNLDMETITRCYYKNQLLELFRNGWYVNTLGNIFHKMESMDLSNPNDLQKFLKEDTEVISIFDTVLDFVYYDFLYEDRYKRAVKDFRKAVITIDTDSVFNNVHKHILKIGDYLGLELNNARKNDIMNVLIHVTTGALGRIFWTLTTNMGLIEKAKPIINMKQEFGYQRILLTRNKKNYAGIITAELGKPLETPVLDMKGLAIRKTNVPKTLRKQFTKILQKDVLEAETINLKKVIDEYDALENLLDDSLKSGSVEYLLPKNLEVIESYKTPDTIEPVRATLIWNALEPESQIIPPEKINMLKLNCFEADDPRLERLKNEHPDKYDALMKVVFNYGVSEPKIDISRFGFSCIAIPKSLEKVPNYLLPFIDYKAMINTNMTNGYIILESLGIYCEEVKTVKYKSNIIGI